MRSSKEIAADIRAINAKGRAMNRLQNEGVQGYDHTADTSALEAEYHAAKKREFEMEWTPEVTAQRRAAWNNSIKNNPPKNYKDVLARQKEFGFDVDALKRAIKLNQL